jgi:hypothetical protein
MSPAEKKALLAVLNKVKKQPKKYMASLVKQINKELVL